MNYKTSRDGDGELLLSCGGNWTENTVIPSTSEKTSPPLDATTPVTESPSEEKPLLGDKEADSTNIRVVNSIPKSDGVSSSSGDLNGRVSPFQSDISSKKEAGEYRESSLSSCPDWVSFGESSNHANSQHLRTDILSPSQDCSKEDNGFPERSANGDNWVKFGIAKGDENTVPSSLTRPEEVVDDAILTSGRSTDEELLELVENLGNDVYTNPFDNSELDRINSFSQVSPKRGNGGPHNTIQKPPASGDTHQTEISQNETSPATDRIDGKTPSTKASEVLPPLLDFPPKPTNTTWSVLLRYPNTKRKFRAREWRPVILKLDGSVLQVFEEHDMSAPFREVSLQCFYALTTPQLQIHNASKVHTVKLLYVKYKECQKHLSKKNVQYIARTTPIIKIASTSHLVIREFVEVVKDAMRSLPIFRDRGISHNTEAVYIDVHDTCSVKLDATGTVLMLGILVRIYLRAFISGDAECQLVLNDIHVKSQEETRLREELMPQRVHKWIDLQNCNFHSTVNPATYDQDHCIHLKPLDSCTFEVMQFRVHHWKPLPLLAHCSLIVDGHGRVEIKADVKLCSDSKLAKYKRKNICLYFPIPDSWVPLFMKEKLFRGERSIKSTSAQKALKMRNKLNRPPCTIEVSTGSAKYEPEYKAIVWRIDELPLLNTTAPADSSHDFTCHVQTMNSSGLPDDYKPHCVMEYEIPYTVASDTNVVNFKVSDKKISTREVSYHTYYSYQLQMNTTSLNGGV